MPGAWLVPGFGVALVWPWCGLGVALVWPWCGLGVALVWPWGGFGVALVWPWGGFVLRSLCPVYAYNMALGWLWVALRGLPPLFLLSTFCFMLLPECGFGWLKRSRFRVQCSMLDVGCWMVASCWLGARRRGSERGGCGGSY